MAKILGTEKLQEARELKYLVIDDEIAKNQRYRQSFIEDLGLLSMSAEFAANCEDALTSIKNNSDIVFCFLDCRLPKSKDSSCNYSPQNDTDAGINLIPEISKISKNLPIIIFSAYVDKDNLERETAKYSSNINIIECLNKDESLDNFLAAVKEALNYIGISIDDHFSQKDTVNNFVVKPTQFNYDQLPAENKQIIEERTKEIKRLIRRSTQDIFFIGKYLTEVKQNLKHGDFYPWLNSELQWSPRSAVRFMKVYSKFKSVNLADLNFSPSVLYELAATTVPHEAVEETIELAKSGETVTIELAKSIKKKHIEKEKVEDGNDSSDLKAEEETASVDAKINTVLNDSSKQTVNPKIIPKTIIDAEKSSIKQNIVKIIPRQNQWQIKKHRIICDNPNSEVFTKLLPNKVSLVLDFSPEREWNYSFVEYDSISIFKTRHEDLDDVGLLSLVKNAVEITTESEDSVVLLNIPNSRILLLLDKLGCQVFIADPDYSKCLALVDASKSIVDLK